MKIKMRQRGFVLVDEFVLKDFSAGGVYEVRESVGCWLVNCGEAKLVSQATPTQPSPASG